MWTPGIVGVVLSWIFGSRGRDIGFKVGRWQDYALSYAFPVAAAALVFVALIVSGIDHFGVDPHLVEKYGSVRGVLMKALVIGPIVGAAFGLVSGLGEEIGWRGFLHSRLMNLNSPHPFLLTGAIWAVWHWPLILFSNYATSNHPFFSLTMFTIMTMSMSVFMGWMRVRSGTVFTAALIHGVHNLWIQGIYPAFLEKKGALDPYFGGESGVFLPVFYGGAAIFIYVKFLRRGRVVASGLES